MPLNIFTNKKFLCFVGGIITAVAAPKVIKSKAAKNLCVKSLATGMKFQKDAREKFQNIKEEAEDIFHDAVNKQEADK